MDWLLPILFMVGGGLFGGGGSSTTQEGPSRYDPGYAMLSPFMLKSLLQRANMFSGFGMPPGSGNALDQNMLGDVFAKIKDEWPGILSGSSNATVNGAKLAQPRRLYG